MFHHTSVILVVLLLLSTLHSIRLIPVMLVILLHQRMRVLAGLNLVEGVLFLAMFIAVALGFLQLFVVIVGAELDFGLVASHGG